MKSVLRAIALGLAGPACAQVAAPATAPTVAPTASAVATSAAPTADAATSAADMAKVRAALQQLEAERDNFNFSASDDDAPAVPVGRPTQSEGLSALLMRGAATPADPSGAPADLHRRLPSAGVQLRINDQIKNLTGVDMGPVDVGVGSKLVLRLKY